MYIKGFILLSLLCLALNAENKIVYTVPIDGSHKTLKVKPNEPFTIQLTGKRINKMGWFLGTNYGNGVIKSLNLAPNKMGEYIPTKEEEKMSKEEKDKFVKSLDIVEKKMGTTSVNYFKLFAPSKIDGVFKFDFVAKQEVVSDIPLVFHYRVEGFKFAHRTTVISVEVKN